MHQIKDKTLILGNGYLGTFLSRYNHWPLLPNRIENIAAVKALIAAHKPDTIINCIGFHGKKNIDECERDRARTFQANVGVPILLGQACKDSAIKLVHLSSGCIFHYRYGTAPITENRQPDHFGTFYARTKIYAEQALQEIVPEDKLLILRIRLPLDDWPHPKNIINKILSFNKIINVPQSVTYLPDLAKALRHLLFIQASGIYNVVNPGKLSFAELLDAYKKITHSRQIFHIVAQEELRANRANVLLSGKKLKDSGYPIKFITSIFEQCLKNYAYRACKGALGSC